MVQSNLYQPFAHLFVEQVAVKERFLLNTIKSRNKVNGQDRIKLCSCITQLKA